MKETEQAVVVRAYLVGRLYLGARSAEEAERGYRTFTGEERAPEPELVDGDLRVCRRCARSLDELIVEAWRAEEQPPLWLASKEERGGK